MADPEIPLELQRGQNGRGRDWTPFPANGEIDGLILFDGVCIFCSRWVRFVLERDREARFRFVAIQSEAGRALAGRLGIDVEDPQTNAVVWDGRIWFKSDAALTVLSVLGPVRPLMKGLQTAPRSLRDAVYDRIARNRYRIFGRSDVCMLPDPSQASRFIV